MEQPTAKQQQGRRRMYIREKDTAATAEIEDAVAVGAEAEIATARGVEVESLLVIIEEDEVSYRKQKLIFTMD